MAPFRRTGSGSPRRWSRRRGCPARCEQEWAISEARPHWVNFASQAVHGRTPPRWIAGIERQAADQVADPRHSMARQGGDGGFVFSVLVVHAPQVPMQPGIGRLQVYGSLGELAGLLNSPT
jgi:hypothetical protein